MKTIWRAVILIPSLNNDPVLCSLASLINYSDKLLAEIPETKNLFIYITYFYIIVRGATVVDGIQRISLQIVSLP